MLLKPLIGPNNWRNRGPLNGCPKIPIRYPVSGIPDKRLQWDQCIHKFVMFKGSWLVVWLPSILFSHSYWVAFIIPNDEVIFFRTGWPWPTNQVAIKPPQKPPVGVIISSWHTHHRALRGRRWHPRGKRWTPKARAEGEYSGLDPGVKIPSKSTSSTLCLEWFRWFWPNRS